MKRFNVEVEKGELILRNENNDVAIIPKNKRSKAEMLLKDGCHACLDSMISSLPKAAGTANVGTVVPGGGPGGRVDQTINQVDSYLGSELYDGMDLPEASVSAKRLHPQHKFFNYEEPEHVQSIRSFQIENGLEPDGVLGENTKKALAAQNRYHAPDDDTSYRNPDKVERGRAAKAMFQEKIKTEAAKIKDGDEFGIDPITVRKLEGASVAHCLGAICNFLDAKVEPGLFKHDERGKQISGRSAYFSNPDFAANVNKEGWQQHKSTTGMKFQVGDIIMKRTYIEENGTNINLGNHAMLVTGVDGGKFTYLDNSGGPVARIRTEDMEMYAERHNRDNGKLEIFRRTVYDGIDLAAETRQNRGWIDPIYLPKKDNYAIPFELVREEEEKKEHKFFSKENLSPMLKAERKTMASFIEGVNEVDKHKFKDIPSKDLEKLAIIAGAITANETEEARGWQYKIESRSRGSARTARLIRDIWKRRKLDDGPLSVGVSQINPRSVPTHVLLQYAEPARVERWKERAKKDPKAATEELHWLFEARLAKEPKLAGAITYEVLVDRYRSISNNPTRYQNNSELFWTTLIKSWQKPNLDAEDRAYIRKHDSDYANNVLNHVSKYLIDR